MARQRELMSRISNRLRFVQEGVKRVWVNEVAASGQVNGLVRPGARAAGETAAGREVLNSAEV